MNFVLGLAVGGMLFGGDASKVPHGLGSIPLRCLYALEISEADYRDCRKPSINAELYGNGVCDGYARSRKDNPCSTERALDWEIGALKELKKALQK